MSYERQSARDQGEFHFYDVEIVETDPAHSPFPTFAPSWENKKHTEAGIKPVKVGGSQRYDSDSELRVPLSLTDQSNPLGWQED